MVRFNRVLLAVGLAGAVAVPGIAHAATFIDGVSFGDLNPFANLLHFDIATKLINTFTPQAAIVPVPAALPLFGSGLVALGYLARKRKKTPAKTEG